MKRQFKRAKAVIACTIVLLILTAAFLATRRVYYAEAQLARYCLYANADEADFKVYVKGGSLIQEVHCKTNRTAEEYIKIGYRSKVYWGYTGKAPFESAYGLGEEAPKLRFDWLVNSRQFVSVFYMFDKDYPIEILIKNKDGEQFYGEYYNPKTKEWISKRYTAYTPAV